MSAIRSEIDHYLDLPRLSRGTRSKLDTAEVLALCDAAARIKHLPWGSRRAGPIRGRYLADLAGEYGISVRTVHRYLASELEVVRAAGYAALFQTGGGPPRQLTDWEPER